MNTARTDDEWVKVLDKVQVGTIDVTERVMERILQKNELRKRPKWNRALVLMPLVVAALGGAAAWGAVKIDPHQKVMENWVSLKPGQQETIRDESGDYYTVRKPVQFTDLKSAETEVRLPLLKPAALSENYRFERALLYYTPPIIPRENDKGTVDHYTLEYTNGVHTIWLSASLYANPAPDYMENSYRYTQQDQEKYRLFSNIELVRMEDGQKGLYKKYEVNIQRAALDIHNNPTGRDASQAQMLTWIAHEAILTLETDAYHPISKEELIRLAASVAPERESAETAR